MTRRTVWGAPVTNPLLLTPERLRELRQLCHPDKHAGSALATKVWGWLEEARKELDKRVV